MSEIIKNIAGTSSVVEKTMKNDQQFMQFFNFDEDSTKQNVVSAKFTILNGILLRRIQFKQKNMK
jgi:hypothetical protein